MAKRSKDKLTDDLFSWEPPEVAVGYPAEVTGNGPLANKIARSVSRALDEARAEHGRGRKTIAGMMSERLGRTVSEGILNKWASEGSSENRIPLDAFIALIEATQADDLLGFVPREFGYEVMPEKYKSIIQLHLLEEHEAKVQSRKQELLAKVRSVL